MVPNTNRRRTALAITIVLAATALATVPGAGAFHAVADETSGSGCNPSPSCWVDPRGYHTSTVPSAPGSDTLSTGDTCNWPGYLGEIPPLPDPILVSCRTSDERINYNHWNDCIIITAETDSQGHFDDDPKQYGVGPGC